jgi:hypothetical protein
MKDLMLSIVESITVGIRGAKIKHFSRLIEIFRKEGEMFLALLKEVRKCSGKR